MPTIEASKPISYIDDNGNPTGYDVEVMKLVDELLPDYQFEYVGTTSDDLLIGVEQGKYQVGVKMHSLHRSVQRSLFSQRNF